MCQSCSTPRFSPGRHHAAMTTGTYARLLIYTAIRAWPLRRFDDGQPARSPYLGICTGVVGVRATIALAPGMLTLVAVVGSRGHPQIAVTDGRGGPTCCARISAVLYWNSPFDPIHWRRAERHFLSHWLHYLLANARPSSATLNFSSWSRHAGQRSAGPLADLERSRRWPRSCGSSCRSGGPAGPSGRPPAADDGCPAGCGHSEPAILACRHWSGF